jgi:type II secretory pathway component PulF
VLDVVPAAASGRTGSWLSAVSFPRAAKAYRGPSRLDVGSFAHELAALLDAGLGIVESLTTLEAKEKAPSQRALLRRLAKTLTEGLPLSHALAEEGPAFPELLTAAVAAAEHTGDRPPRCDASPKTRRHCAPCAVASSEPRFIRRSC